MFPEGRTHGLGTRLRPFAPGAARIAVWSGGDDGPLPVVPLAVFYRASRPGDAFAALGLLEEDLGLEGRGSPYDRLRRSGLGVLAAVEAEEGIRPDDTLPVDDRVARFYATALDRLECELGVPAAPDQGPEARVHALRMSLDESPDRHPDQERRIMRLHRFGTLEDGHVAECPTPERVLDLVTLLRWERASALGRRSPRPFPREAWVDAGEAVTPSGDAAADTDSLQGATRTLMDRMEADLSSPLEGFL